MLWEVRNLLPFELSVLGELGWWTSVKCEEPPVRELSSSKETTSPQRLNAVPIKLWASTWCKFHHKKLIMQKEEEKGKENKANLKWEELCLFSFRQLINGNVLAFWKQPHQLSHSIENHTRFLLRARRTVHKNPLINYTRPSMFHSDFPHLSWHTCAKDLQTSKHCYYFIDQGGWKGSFFCRHENYCLK